jgi:hypothetical protein
MTTLINVRVKNLRCSTKYNNLKEWCANPNHVYIGRKGIVFVDGERYPKVDSIWCNPYKLKDMTREESIAEYRKYITEKLKNKHMKSELMKLKNKVLGCWCSPNQCHGDVLIELINKLS